MPGDQMPDPIYIEVLTSPNCVHSPKAMRVARMAVMRSGDAIILREVSIASAEGADRAEALRVEATPAIMINGAIAYVGVPTLGALRRMVSETVAKEKERNSYFF